MAIKTKNGYKCFYCEKEYTHPEEADSCRESHDIVYVPIAREDLNYLLHFIMFPKEDTLQHAKRAVHALRKASNVKARKQF